jgi:hypothetical protein
MGEQVGLCGARSVLRDGHFYARNVIRGKDLRRQLDYPGLPLSAVRSRAR